MPSPSYGQRDFLSLDKTGDSGADTGLAQPISRAVQVEVWIDLTAITAGSLDIQPQVAIDEAGPWVDLGSPINLAAVAISGTKFDRLANALGKFFRVTSAVTTGPATFTVRILFREGI